MRDAVARVTRLARPLAARASEHGLLVYASAISFRAIVSLVPLVLLTLGVLGALGQQEIWRDTIAPAIQDRFTQPVYHAIDTSAEKILTSGSAGLIAFASVLLAWNLAASVFVVMSALSRIHEVDDGRRWTRRALVAAGLGIAIGLCILGAMLVVALLGRVDAGSIGNGVLAAVKWVAAVGLLGLAVGLLVRYAPAEHPGTGWASAGSIVIVASWIVATLLFRWWVTGVADFKSATGQLTFFLLLTAYVFVVTGIFLVGVELDELVRSESKT